MIKYKISSENPQSHFLNIEMVIDNIQSDTIELQLPAWRPGRYELQNFAKNIQRFEVFRTPSFQGGGGRGWGAFSQNDQRPLAHTYN